MSVAFMKNAYNQSQTRNNTINTTTIIEVSDIFALKVFNRPAYNRKINKFLIASFLLG